MNIEEKEISGRRRREFLRILGVGSGAGVLTALQACGGGGDYQSSESLYSDLLADSDFWSRSRKLFTGRTGNKIYFDIDADLTKPSSTSKILAASTLRKTLSTSLTQDDLVEPRDERLRMARNLGVDLSQVAFVDSATDGMMKLLLGLAWEPGQVVVTSNQEHPSILAFLRSARHIFQIEIAVVNLPLQVSGAEEIADLSANG
ncbi:MAG: hypothetical protein QM788_05640 [Roseateles sp.]|uniref:hypothetical protein n=1 Tax=Roseateles sp. TaxID=1971397 RepID=UPI0039E7C204